MNNLQTDVSSSLAAGTQGLDKLRAQAKQSPAQALKSVSQQFESVFMNMMLKSMRQATPQDGIFDSEQTKMFTGMLDQQLVQNMSTKGIGLANIIAKQLGQTVNPSHSAAASTKDSSTLSNNTAVSAKDAITAIKKLPASVIGNISKPSYQGHGLTNVTAQQLMQSLNLNDEETSPEDLPANLLDSVTNLPPTQKTAAVSNTNAIPSAYNDNFQQGFVQRMTPYAQQASKETGVSAPLMMGQAALESGWGRHEIKTADGSNSYNLFGIKADSSWKGKVAEVTTTEYINGKPTKQVAKFRAYGSYTEAFSDYAKFLSNNPRYAPVLQGEQNAPAAAQALQRAGYATDPNYAEKLVKVMNSINRLS